MSPMSFSARLSFPAVLISALSLGPFAAQAHPLDSPETVYIDGVPCNGACQSYMAWSRKTLGQNSDAARTAAPAHSATREVSHTRIMPVTPKRKALLSSRQTIPVQTPRAKTAEARTAEVDHPTGAIPTNRSVQPKQEMPESKPEASENKQEMPEIKPETPAHQTAALETQPAAPPPQAVAPAGLTDKTIEQQILAATALAEHVTAASMPAPDNKEVAANSGQAESTAAKDAAEPQGDGKEAATALPPRSPDLVVLILARADIKSIADLANKDIAIEDKQAQFREQIRTGIVAAGAPMVELRDGKESAIDRLVSGEQSAAVLTLASPEAADWFPEIKGFRTFRIPLSPS